MHINSRNLTNLLLLFISLAAWWFTAFVVHPELHYYLQQTAFLTDRFFFQGFVRYPGGIADYFSEFVAQFFYFNVWGSLLIVLVAAIQGIIAINLVQRISGKSKFNFIIFSLILLLSVWVQCDYHYRFYAAIRLLLSSGFVWVFAIIIQKFPRLRIFASFLMAAILFYIAGGAALLAFTAAILFIQIRFLQKKTDWIALPVLALFSGVLPYLAYKYFFLVDLPLVYSITHSKSPVILYYAADFKLYTLYSLLPVFILLSVLYQFKKVNEKALSPKIEKEKETKPAPKTDKKNSGKGDKKTVIHDEKVKKENKNPQLVWLSVQVIGVLVLAIICLYTTFDKAERDKKFVSFYGAKSDWANVIKTTEGIKEYDIFINFEYNKALANTGKLAENMLNYPQLAGSYGLFLDMTVSQDVLFNCSDQFYDLGFINESQHWTFEAQTIFPNSPRLMKRLVQIHLVNRQYKIAEKFLNRLSENMLYQDWVSKHRIFIQDTSLVAKDPDFVWKRKCQPRGNFTASSSVDKLYKLMEANPANRMAWEYLLCYSLLDTDLGTFERLLRENRTIKINPLPRSWDEGMVLYSYVSRKAPAANDIRFTKERQAQFVSFVNAMTPFGNDWQSAKQSLKKEFGTSYWYYTKCLSPKVTKAQIKIQK